MNYQAFYQELGAIRAAPNNAYVAIDTNNNAVNFWFKDPDGRLPAYYYPVGIHAISVPGGGAGVIYVYTSEKYYPHLTIPDTGQGVHWTDEARTRFYDSKSWPESMQLLVKQFP